MHYMWQSLIVQYYDYDTFEASASTVYDEPGISMIVSDSATNTDMDMSVDELDEINESFELFTVNDNNIQSTSSMPVQFGFKKKHHTRTTLPAPTTILRS